MNLVIITAHAGADSLEQATKSWCGTAYKWEPIVEPTSAIALSMDPELIIADGKHGMLPAYQYGYNLTSHYDVQAYLHDDTIIHDPKWIERVMAEFEDPTVGLVGFGGATGHGAPGIYRKPYEYQQLARSNFMSNMDDAENHGKRFIAECDVAVLDGFSLIVRTDVLRMAGGWPINTAIGYVCYDYWLSCMTRRLGYRIRLVGVPCAHLGGRTFVKLGIGKDPAHWQQYIDSHKYIYDEFKDVLPFEA